MGWKVLFEPVDFSGIRWRALLKRAAFEASFVFLLFVATEISLRLAGLLILAPRQIVDLARVPTEGEFRILAIGESTTFGLGVKREEAYPEVLGRMLNEEGKGSFVVFNTGVPGQTSTSILRNIRYQMEKYHPHLVICLFGANDLNEALNDMSSRRLFGFHVPDSIADLRTYRLACVFRDYVLLHPEIKPEGAWIAVDESQKSPSGEWIQNISFLDQLELNYKSILEVIRDSGARAMMLSYFRCYYALAPKLKEISEETGTPYLDMRTDKTDSLDIFTEDAFHPNQEGHRLMAEQILAFLKANQLLPETSLTSPAR
ncbi:MAG: hypothetical protein GHCLOJNM_02863 [bacterium]|nr:hypothetical protein [bacterium]